MEDHIDVDPALDPSLARGQGDRADGDDDDDDDSTVDPTDGFDDPTVDPVVSEDFPVRFPLGVVTVPPESLSASSKKRKFDELVPSQYASFLNSVDRFLCPITKCLPLFPVIAGDGMTYEYSSIVEVFYGARSSGLTRAVTKVRSPVTRSLMSLKVSPNKTVSTYLNVLMEVVPVGLLDSLDELRVRFEKHVEFRSMLDLVEKSPPEFPRYDLMLKLAKFYLDGSYTTGVPDYDRVAYWLTKILDGIGLEGVSKPDDSILSEAYFRKAMYQFNFVSPSYIGGCRAIYYLKRSCDLEYSSYKAHLLYLMMERGNLSREAERLKLPKEGSNLPDTEWGVLGYMMDRKEMKYYSRRMDPQKYLDN